jgi:hypothetical protein
MSTPPPLRELQLRLRELIFRNGDGTAAALAALERGAADLPIAGDDRLSAGQRLSVYAGMHFLRIRDVLAEDFPATRAAAGAGFDRLVQRYLFAHPTDDPSLRRAGRHLPRFLAAHPEECGFAWQGELAALEWAMIDAFDALDQEVLTAAALAELAPEDWPDLRLEPVRSARVLDLAYPVDEIRTSLLAGEPPPAAPPGARSLRVWRQGGSVFHRRIGAADARAWRLLGGGQAFAALCDGLAGEQSPEDAAREALGLLRDWLDDELLAALPTA